MTHTHAEPQQQGWLARAFSSLFLPTARVPGRPDRDLGRGTRVPGRDPRSRPCADPSDSVPAESRPSPSRVRGSKPGTNGISGPPRTLYLGVGDQVRSFVAWMLEDGDPVRFTDKRVVQNYLRWAEEWNVVPIPSSILLANLKQHPDVRHARERELDQHGRAKRNANGTPIRPSYYTFAVAVKKRQPKLPGKVPVTEIVPQAPLLSRPKVQPEELPLQEAA
jgi:hypothetical protein